MIRHLPVVEDGSVVVGMLSMGDIIHNLVSEQQSEIRQLQNYIQGAYG
jgi:CBS domain-containing protein